MSERLSEQLALVAAIDPDANTAAAYTSDWVNMEYFSRAIGILLAGTLGSSATLDFKFQQATDGSGTGAKNITGKAATQLTDGGSDSDKQVIIEIEDVDLDVSGGFTHVAVVMTVATATSDCGALILAGGASYHPASDNDLASVDEIVV